MIKSTELRQGNMLNYVIMNGGEVIDSTPVIVTDILIYETFKTMFLDNSGGRDSADCPDDFQAVPITPELLEMCNFEKDKFGWSHSSHPVSLYVDMKTLYWKEQPCGGVPIKYLHQLQNIFFALTGEEISDFE